jgi:hypothetical protein
MQNVTWVLASESCQAIHYGQATIPIVLTIIMDTINSIRCVVRTHCDWKNNQIVISIDDSRRLQQQQQQGTNIMTKQANGAVDFFWQLLDGVVRKKIMVSWLSCHIW